MSQVSARDSWLGRFSIWGPALLVFALHAAFLTVYGIHRDELYYLACAARLDWGYVDHPPLIAVIVRLWTALFGDSLAVLRLLPALAAAATVATIAATARCFSASAAASATPSTARFAALLAGLAAGLAPIALSLNSVLSMNAFDLLFWSLCFWILARWLGGGSNRLWLLFGLVAGVGLENKFSVLFLGFGVVIGLALAQRWDAFRTREFWLGGGIAAALLLPHLLWQFANDWPTRIFLDNARRLKNVDLPAYDFLSEQVTQSNPLAAPIWICGLVALLILPRLRPWRVLGVAFLVVLAVMLSTEAKPYYLAPAFAPLWAAGAAAIASWTDRALARTAILLIVVASNLALAPLARPVLPVESYVRYAAALGHTPGTDERKEVGRLPQFFADMQEWRELAGAVAEAQATLSPEERAAACVFGQNYGEAGAIERFRAEFALPPAIAAHNSWYLWGPGACTGDVLLVIGGDREQLGQFFESVEPGAVFDCRDCMPYEDNLTIWIGRRLRQPLKQAWPAIRNYS